MTKAIVMIYKAKFHSYLRTAYSLLAAVFPISPSPSPSPAIAIAILVLSGSPIEGHAAPSSQSQIGILTRQSPVEPNAALGITGTSMGISVRRVPLALLGKASSSIATKPQPRATDPSHSSADPKLAVAPAFHLVKGLWYPVDVGYSFSYIDEVTATLQSFFAQVELVPGIRYPSLSIRVGYHSLSSYDWHQAKSFDAAAMITIRGIPWTSLYGAIGGAAHQIETDNSPGLFYDNFYTIGAKFRFPTPFIGWGIEHSHWPTSGDSEIKLKTSFNI